MKHVFKKGKFDSSTFSIGVHFCKTRQRFKVKFSKECLYTPIDWENDWNKLIGWSYGMHHNNSIRVNWRSLGGVIQLCLYAYSNKTRTTSEKIITLQAEVEYEFELVYDKGSKRAFLVSNADASTWLQLEFTSKPSIGYILWPYFGGSNPAPQDMIIELTRL